MKSLFSKHQPTVKIAGTVLLFAAVFMALGLFVLPLTLSLETASASNERADLPPEYKADDPVSPKSVPAEPEPEIAAPNDAHFAQTEPTPEPRLIVYPVNKETQGPSRETSEFTQFGPEDDDPYIKELQSRLMELEYMDSDAPTEHYGPMTKNAVELFQAMHGLSVTGNADEATQKLLFDESALSYRMKKGSEGKDVLSLQERLFDLGYFDGIQNGYYGTATERSVRTFQLTNELVPDGTANSETRELLYSPGAIPIGGPEPTPSPKPSPTPVKRTPKPTASPKPSPTPNSATPKPLEPTFIPVPTPISPTTSSVPSPIPSSVPSPTFPLPPSPSPTAKQTEAPVTGYGREAMIAVALNQLGKPYRWSEEGPDGFDCSGLVYYSLQSVGIKTSRYSASGFSQVQSWAYVSSIGALQRGDLMFFKSDSDTRISHTGIYLGNGAFVHASSGAGRVVESTLSSWYERNFVLGRRVF